MVAIAINHENLDKSKMAEVCQGVSREIGLPACDPLLNGAGPLVAALKPYLESKNPPSVPPLKKGGDD